MDILSSSGIIATVNSYVENETSKQVSPLSARKSKYQNLSTAWGNLSSKIDSLKSLLSDLKNQETSSVFTSKSALVSSASFLAASADNTASLSAYTLRINQLAKSDMAVSSTLSSSSSEAVSAGVHTIQIKSGDYTARVSVDLTSATTNQSVMEQIRDAINKDKAVVSSASKLAADTAGASTFELDVNGTKTSISVDAGSYSDMIDQVISKVNGKVSGLTAEKVTDGENVSLKFTLANSSQYISISDVSGTFASDMNVVVTKEKAASALATASAFSPSNGKSKFSITAKESGYANRLQITGSILGNLGLNSDVLTNRYKVANDDSAGFILGQNYYDSASSSAVILENDTNNLLNSKFIFNGVNIQRSSNTITDVAQGVTFTLKAVMQPTDAEANVTVSSNSDQIKGKIESFISKFNDVYVYIKSRYTSDKLGRGLFTGDATASAIMSNMNSIVNSKITGLPEGNLNRLSQLGISFDPLSGLSLSDSSKLTTAISENAGQVEALFNSENGLANSLYSMISGYAGTDGVISKLKSTYDSNITAMTDKITATQNRIDKSAEILRKKYQDLQMQLSRLYSLQSSYSTTGSFF